LFKNPFTGTPEEHYHDLSSLFERHLKRPPRRPRRLGWESKLAHTDAADLLALRSTVDHLEEEYERSSTEITYESLITAKVKLVRRTAVLQRQVAEILLAVRVLSQTKNRLLYFFLLRTGLGLYPSQAIYFY
jgi:hypothetical protein